MAFTRNGSQSLTLEQLANRVAWVKALVSGDYEQGRQKLLTVDGSYCCLGVAGQVLELDADAIANRALLPAKWANDKLGLVEDEIHTPDQNAAADWNDSKGLSFLQIADRVALATEKSQLFSLVGSAPELMNEEPGTYAHEWLKQQV